MCLSQTRDADDLGDARCVETPNPPSRFDMLQTSHLPYRCGTSPASEHTTERNASWGRQPLSCDRRAVVCSLTNAGECRWAAVEETCSGEPCSAFYVAIEFSRDGGALAVSDLLPLSH